MLDFNLDGVLDVVISSPTTMSEQLWYQVYIIRGKVAGCLLSMQGKVEVFFGHDGASSWYPSDSADVTLLGDGWYCNFGKALTTGKFYRT